MRIQNCSEDVTCLIFWLYNVTVWLHLMQCDNSINDACEMLGSFELLEQVINSVFGERTFGRIYSPLLSPASFYHPFRRAQNRPVTGCSVVREFTTLRRTRQCSVRI